MSGANAVFVDGVDLATLGFEPTGIPGWRDGPVFDWQAQTVPGRIGVVVSELATAGPRVLQVRGRVFGASPSDRLTAINQILAACSGERSLRFGDATGRHIVGRYRTHQVLPVAAGNELHANTWVVLVIEFVCPAPYFEDISSSVINLSGTPADIPVGPLPSGGIVQIDGPATNPRITLYDASGGEVAALELTASLGGGDWIEVDLDRGRIETSLDTNPMMLWTGGDWFLISHEHGEYGTSSWPKLALSSGSGKLTYVKRYPA